MSQTTSTIITATTTSGWKKVLEVEGFVTANEPYDFNFIYTPSTQTLAPDESIIGNKAYSKYISNNDTSHLYVKVLRYDIEFAINKE